MFCGKQQNICIDEMKICNRVFILSFGRDNGFAQLKRFWGKLNIERFADFGEVKLKNIGLVGNMTNREFKFIEISYKIKETRAVSGRPGSRVFDKDVYPFHGMLGDDIDNTPGDGKLFLPNCFISCDQTEKAKQPKGNRPVYFLIFDFEKQIKEGFTAYHKFNQNG